MENLGLGPKLGSLCSIIQIGVKTVECLDEQKIHEHPTRWVQCLFTEHYDRQNRDQPCEQRCTTPPHDRPNQLITDALMFVCCGLTVLPPSLSQPELLHCLAPEPHAAWGMGRGRGKNVTSQC